MKFFTNCFGLGSLKTGVFIIAGFEIILIVMQLFFAGITDTVNVILAFFALLCTVCLIYGANMVFYE